ncbi:sensor histidine kinase [Actinomycetospora soli]|uniref:sensor histidine kinase n=1 Tax=Actinomycetospora soli TaxID=2893887 RepID=UPI001E4B6032|nr:HAMP domain-containing sensor histidine kinase [Actinomycetospora soli]MCD2191132.1 ATP-binding protein [Actinomycetospora soli]
MTARRTASLRVRVAVSFGLVTLVVCGALSAATWFLTTGYATAQRENAVRARVSADATLVVGTRQFRPGGLPDLLAGLGGEPDTTVLLRSAGSWARSGPAVSPDALPLELTALSPGDPPVVMRIEVDGREVMAGSAGLGTPGDLLVELAPVRELQSTRRFLALLLTGGTAAATVAGAVLGAWTARRSLRPLHELTAAASLVARGDLDARLPTRADPELAALATTFNRTVEDLGDRVRRDARFAGDVSHELRSPLTTLLGATDVLRRRRDDLPPAAREAVDLLGPDLDRFVDTVDDLLEISRMDQPVDERDLDRVDLAGLTRAVARRQGLEDRVDAVPGDTHVVADRRRLDAVLTNLCTNADRHGGGVVRLGVGPAPEDPGTVRLEVDDAGPGVAREDRTEIFERFARGSTAGRRGAGTGSGLGLALVNGHVRRHGGRVWVTDRPGGGARFVVELPVAEDTI